MKGRTGEKQQDGPGASRLRKERPCFPSETRFVDAINASASAARQICAPRGDFRPNHKTVNRSSTLTHGNRTNRSSTLISAHETLGNLGSVNE